jgi:alcohol dehydrogenase class IV
MSDETDDVLVAAASESLTWWSMSAPARVSFGVGCRRFLPDVVQSLGTRVLICTDRNLVAAGVIEPLVDSLRSISGVEILVYDEGEAEIGFAGAERCAAQVRSFAPTVVVGIGGGSNLDLAKVVAVRLIDDRGVASWVSQGIPSVALPVVALPTTAGTGSEVTPIAVLTDEQRQVKTGFQAPALLPRAVLVDPMLTLSCPPRVTAYSGMDALSHAVESLLDISFADKPAQTYFDHGFVGKNPASDALAKEAITLIARSLVTAVHSGDDLAARTDMALGSLLAGLAFSAAGTAVVHALQYPLGALTKTAHGHGNAILMPSAVRFNLSVRQSEAAYIAWTLGSTATSKSVAATELPDLLGELALRVGITPNLRSIGVNEADIEPLATAALGITRLLANNPRPLDLAALMEVLNGALDFLPGEGP